VVLLAGCSRDPNVAKLKYVESGNKYFARGKYKEARIMYLDALQQDKRYGQAYYRLALTALKIGPVNEAVESLRRAVELLPPSDKDHWDAVVRLTEVYLLAGREQKQILDDVERFCEQLLKRDPDSFDGHRLKGDLLLARSAMEFKVARKEEAESLLKASIAEYDRANTLKASDDGVMMQLARANSALGNFDRAEALYKQTIEHNKTLQVAYSELYKLYTFQRKMNDGEQILKTGFAANPKQFGFLTTLALHYSMTGRMDEMRGVLSQIKTHSSEFDQAFLVVGDFYLRIGDGDTAIKEYKEGIAKDSKKKITYEKRIIEVYMRQGRR